MVPRAFQALVVTAPQFKMRSGAYHEFQPPIRRRMISYMGNPCCGHGSSVVPDQRRIVRQFQSTQATGQWCPAVGLCMVARAQPCQISSVMCNNSSAGGLALPSISGSFRYDDHVAFVWWGSWWWSCRVMCVRQPECSSHFGGSIIARCGGPLPDRPQLHWAKSSNPWRPP